MKMNVKNMIHLAIATVVNIIFIWVLIKIAWGGNDKAIIVTFYYAILFIINLIIMSALIFMRKDQSDIYKTTTIGLAILFFPVLFIASLS
jgi:hypothetical protein